MIRISFIVTKPEQIDLVRNIYEEHCRYHEDGKQYEFHVYSATMFKDVPPDAFDTDILIARGLVTAGVRSAFPEVAVVDVPMGSELILTIFRAINDYGRLPIGITGSFNVINSAWGLGEALGADIKTYFLDAAPNAIPNVVEQMAKDGRRIAICGPKTALEASKRGLTPVFLGMNRESIWQALSEAKHGAVIKRREREKAGQFGVVLDYAYEGVLATDMRGKITVFNAVAGKILGLAPEEAVGSRIEEVVPRGPLKNLLCGNADYRDKIVLHDGELLSVNKISVLLSADFSGHVVTMQKSSEVQRTENRIRQQLYAKGHVARYTFDDIIGASKPILAAVDKAKRFAGVTSNIMITGETGTGKELFAQSIHNSSLRADRPFVAINCAALSPSLLESEIFGYVEGAFTGARKEGKPGIFEIAHTGTIFLDEISEIPLELQGRLLRILQERQVMRLGDDKVIPIDVRVISAANKQLLQQVERNEFRRDLYYRLNVLSLALPPLNRRGTDVLRIASMFLEEYGREMRKQPLVLANDACERLFSHPWKGNIRELRNICEYLAVLNKTGTITGEDLAEALEPADYESTPPETSYVDELISFEKDRIQRALHLHKGDKTAASKKLGMSRTTLWRKLKELGIKS